MPTTKEGRARSDQPAARVRECEWTPVPGGCRWFPVVSASIERFRGEVCVRHLSWLTHLASARSSALTFTRLPR